MIPIESWQFWIVTLVSLIGVYALIRPFISSSKNSNGACCGGSKKKKTKLTIDGKKQ